MSLTREQIENAPVTVEAVPVPELNIKGGTVFVRVLDPDGVMHLATRADALKGNSGEIAFLYEVVCRTVCDEKGACLYKPDELNAVRGWNSFHALERVANAALKLNGMDEDSAEARKEELAHPLAGSSLRSRGSGRAHTKKRNPARRRKQSSSASR